MERRRSISRGEAALEQLLQRIDDAIDEYSRSRRSHSAVPRRRADAAIDEDATADSLDEYWEAWWALPLSIRDWLLWYAPGWWALAPGTFRRFLLTTAGLIVWNHMPPRLAIRRAAARLRLPPPRPRTRAVRSATRSRLRQFRSAARSRRRPASDRRIGRRTESRAVPRSRVRRRFSATPISGRWRSPARRSGSIARIRSR